VTLYAQWSRDTRSEYTVKHYRQKADLTGYELMEREILLADPGASVEPSVRTYTGCTTPPVQTHTVPQDDSLEISYYYDRAKYIVTFDGNGATSGQMDLQEILSEVATALRKNAFSKLGHIFLGWQDNEGNTYTDQQVLNLRRGNGSILPLTARWMGNDNEVQPTSGEVIVTCRAGETVVFPDLPAGTQYTVEEIDNPAGFATGVIEEGKGSILPNAVSRSTVNNRYTAEGIISLEAHKAVEGGVPEEDKYVFELLDSSGNVLQRMTNGPVDTAAETFDDEGNLIPNPWQGTASVLFDVLTFTQADIGTKTFYIREVAGDDERMDYDAHRETVTVTITDAGNGTLDVKADYDSDGALFTNRPKTGELLLSKEILGATEGAAGTPFTFTLKLKDAAGNDIPGEFPVRIRHEDYGMQSVGVDATAYSYTQNLNQEGILQSKYGNNWGNTHIRGTGRTGSDPQAHVVKIPGAARLHVAITWGGESSNYDWACMWSGERPDVTAYNNFDSSLTGKLGGGSYMSAANTREYDVEGDSVTFSFRSDGSKSGDGYGYYAVITSEKEEVLGGYTDTVVASGGSLQLKGGETAVITGLPDGASYEIVESDAPGWEKTGKTGDTGTIDILDPAESVFTNTYKAECEAVIRANKKVTGGAKLPKETYSFSLQDEEGNTLYTAYADPVEGDWPTEGAITFPAIGYTAEDAGKTYRYFIAENPGTDEATTYDSHVEGVTVTIRDEGEGGLRAEVVYEDPVAGALFINHVEVPPLPETGGIGTRLFFVLGATLVLLGGMLLLIRRRTAN
jgi:pilin isopeptide linkage protein/LPXTG-motif cell wall-anchored protein